MPKKRHTPEEIVAKLRQVDVLVSQGQNIADAIRQIGVSEVTYYRWRQEYGGLKTEQVKLRSTQRRRSVLSPSCLPFACKSRQHRTCPQLLADRRRAIRRLSQSRFQRVESGLLDCSDHRSIFAAQRVCGE
jgi:Transposase